MRKFERIWWPTGNENGGPSGWVVEVDMDTDKGKLRIDVRNLYHDGECHKILSLQRDWLKQPGAASPSSPPSASGASAAPGAF